MGCLALHLSEKRDATAFHFAPAAMLRSLRAHMMRCSCRGNVSANTDHPRWQTVRTSDGEVASSEKTEDGHRRKMPAGEAPAAEPRKHYETGCRQR